ncbi:MAG: MiaB/RimO family radical SAM methylthiotransferase [Synergistaceae bacterium]|jgi:threonylcarbamoyladenosine tRNA methylthiotransferase MtaB|nr:MiaB/RimO family radical SAM methylthiotransferase [Synergistaceae bacterium]
MPQYLVSGMKFSVVILGCRVNHYEGEALASMLEARGAIHVKDPAEGAGIIIVVTCSLTASADSHARKTLRRLRRENSGAVIVACGCYVQSAGSEGASSLGADVLVGNGLKHEIPDALENFLARGGVVRLWDATDRAAWDGMSLDRARLHTRAFVKVQDGCSMRCSYCAVPNLRGPQVSRDPEGILDEISRVTDSGCREVILTGIHLGSYRHGDTTLADLTRGISRIGGLSRLRFGSIEPFALDDDLLCALAEAEVFCPHLHIPLQSGDDSVLRAMRRGYDASGYARRIERVREFLGDDVHVSTDVMVGFPGESDEAFGNSMNFLEDVSFGRVHVFPFSPREGTPAAAMEGRVPGQVVRERVGRALCTSDRLLSSYAGRFVGRESRIVAESAESDIVSGWNRHYIRVHARRAAEKSRWTELSLRPGSEAGGELFCLGVEPGDVTCRRGELP